MQIYCTECGQMQGFEEPEAGDALACYRCRHVLVPPRYQSNLPALVLTLSALLLYIPANIYPILNMTYLGRRNESTILDGVITLYHDGMLALAVLIFLVSIAIPLVKILVLMFLLLVHHLPFLGPEANHRLLRFVDSIGPWSMLDVFLVAVLVALVKLQDLARAEPGPGLVAFAGVAILTLVASHCFDSRLLWKEADER